MINFKTVSETVVVSRTEETWDTEPLALVGHLPLGTEAFRLSILESTVAIERGRGDRLIFAEAKDVENWQVNEHGFKQVKAGRGRVGIDWGGGFCGSSARPDCAKIYVPFTYAGAIEITVGGNSRLFIDFASCSNFSVYARDQAKVELGSVYCTGKLGLTSTGSAEINGALLTTRAFEIDSKGGITIRKVLCTTGELDVEGCPMELRYPDEPCYQHSMRNS